MDAVYLQAMDAQHVRISGGLATLERITDAAVSRGLQPTKAVRMRIAIPTPTFTALEPGAKNMSCSVARGAIFAGAEYLA